MECIYNNNYLIYNDGRVYSKYSNRFLEGGINKTGYRVFYLNGKLYKGHRLVAIHYIANTQNYDCVDHIDGNKLNNDVSNLRWCNNIQNCNAYQSVRSNNISGHKNISYCNTYKKWKYQKKYYGKNIIKRFTSKTDVLCFKYIILLRIKAGHFKF